MVGHGGYCRRIRAFVVRADLLAPRPSAGGLGRAPPAPISGDWYTLASFGSLSLTIGYYIDSLTIAMFCMVTLVASCIHVYSLGYMHEELHEVKDPLAKLESGEPLVRRGRFYRFFQYLSLFCFSMLGLVIAGNLAMVFAFWELVGICSYLLIGFYIERKSASNAANKAFIVNRVGDFGMIIGLMAIFAGMGTLRFGDKVEPPGVVHLGIFSQVRSPFANHEPRVPVDMVLFAARPEAGKIAARSGDHDAAVRAVLANVETWRGQGYGYGLLIVAGLGIFCGCVGKSAQFPLHVWLPDAMEGPTPVSALIHAATMVAAGVYLVGRCYPIFTPEVLLVIAVAGTITLFMAATIAITATDIKRVLAYSTVSQLGYMMMALGLGGWLAGMFHLFTHAFFKSLLFLGSGSVIHATGTNEMPAMGGLRKKMPWTAGTMLVGCLAISGAGIPLVVGLSGYYSKDGILAQAMSFAQSNPLLRLLLLDRHGGGRDYGLLHVPPLVHDLCRPAPRRPRLSPCPRVALGDGGTAGGAGRVRRGRRLDASPGQLRPADAAGTGPAAGHGTRGLGRLGRRRSLCTRRSTSRMPSHPCSHHALGLRLGVGRFPAGDRFLRLADAQPGRRAEAVRRRLSVPRAQVVVRRTLRPALRPPGLADIQLGRRPGQAGHRPRRRRPGLVRPRRRPPGRMDRPLFHRRLCGRAFPPDLCRRPAAPRRCRAATCGNTSCGLPSAPWPFSLDQFLLELDLGWNLA